MRGQAAYSRYRVSIPRRVSPEHRGELAEVNASPPESLKKLNVFPQIEVERSGAMKD
jgi:hypothetical protein